MTAYLQEERLRSRQLSQWSHTVRASRAEQPCVADSSPALRRERVSCGLRGCRSRTWRRPAHRSGGDTPQRVARARQWCRDRRWQYLRGFRHRVGRFPLDGLSAPLGVDLALIAVRHTLALVRRSKEFGDPHPIVSDRILGSDYRPEGNALTLMGTTTAMEREIDYRVEDDRPRASITRRSSLSDS